MFPELLDFWEERSVRASTPPEADPEIGIGMASGAYDIFKAQLRFASGRPDSFEVAQP
jgi:hypothetical protein